MDLQGIKTGNLQGVRKRVNFQGAKTEAQLHNEIDFYRKALTDKLGDFRMEGETVNLLASLQQKHYEGALLLGDFLQLKGQDQILDELLSDLQTLEQAQRRLSLIHALLAEIDNESEEDLPGKKKIRATLADLSLELKRTIRLNT